MKNLKINIIKGTDKSDCILVNDRYEIYFDDGCVYDTDEASDIPQYVFDIRDIAKAIHEAGYRKVPEGKWRKMYLQYECPFCRRLIGSRMDEMTFGQIKFGNDTFCPSCGARMKGGE